MISQEFITKVMEDCIRNGVGGSSWLCSCSSISRYRYSSTIPEKDRLTDERGERRKGRRRVARDFFVLFLSLLIIHYD